MSDLKTECPGCHAYSSAVGIAIENGDPCPYCGIDLSDQPTRARRQFDELVRIEKATAWDEGAETVLRVNGWENTKRALDNLAENGIRNPYRPNVEGTVTP